MNPIENFSLTRFWPPQTPTCSLAAAASPSETKVRHSQPTQFELEQVCTEFASILFQTLLKSMYSTIPKTSLCPQLEAKDLINSFLDQGLVRFMALQNAAGLKDLLMAQITKTAKP